MQQLQKVMKQPMKRGATPLGGAICQLDSILGGTISLIRRKNGESDLRRKNSVSNRCSAGMSLSTNNPRQNQLTPLNTKSQSDE